MPKIRRNSVEEYKIWIKKEVKKNPYLSHWDVHKRTCGDWEHTLMVMQAMREIDAELEQTKTKAVENEDH